MNVYDEEIFASFELVSVIKTEIAKHPFYMQRFHFEEISVEMKCARARVGN